MLTRRKFLAGAIAAAVAPMVAPEVVADSISDIEWDKFIWPGTSAATSAEPITLAEIRKMAALLKQYSVKPIMYRGEPCYRLETFSGRHMIPMDLYEP